MKKKTAAIVILLFILEVPSFLFAEKFQDSLTATSLKNNPPMAQTQIPSSTPLSQSTSSEISPPVSLTTVSTTSIPATTIPETQSAVFEQQNLPSSSPIQKNVLDAPKVKITVPSFEKQFQDQFLEQTAKTAKKKKKLFESIIDEVAHYGLYLVLIFVLLVVFYALRKDKQSPFSPSDQKPPEEKQDIWHEDF